MNLEAQNALRKDCERVFHEINDTETFSRLNGTSLLITGGTGFLGSWICHFLAYVQERLNINFKVYVVARDKQKFQERCGHLSGLELEFIRCDVRQLTELPRDVNYVIHAAGNPDSRFHMTNPVETMTVIAEGTSTVLRAADRVSNLRMVVHLSSGSVYGEQAESTGVASESHPLAVPALDSLKSVYTEAKRYSEVLCTSARSELRLPIIILRPFTFLGPFQSLQAPWAINNFIQDGLMGRSIRILGDGKTTRGFLYGADAAGWIVKVMLTGKANQVYNIGSPVGSTLLDIAEKVASKFQPRLDVTLNCSLVANIAQKRYLPDIGKLTRDFDLKPVTDLDTAIQRTIDWYQGANSAAKDSPG